MRDLGSAGRSRARGSAWCTQPARASRLNSPSRGEYHGHVFGFLVGEAARRTTGLTPGRFFRESIGDPLRLRAWIGLPDSGTPWLAEAGGRPAAGDGQFAFGDDEFGVGFAYVANRMTGYDDARANRLITAPRDSLKS